MSHFILVHGAWEESGMWDNVAPILEQNGHTVTAVDLPGHGANKQEGLQVTTELYIEALVEVISELDYPVILAGHSMNGALISNVAEKIPEKIERLVYVTAFLLKNGGSVYSAMQGDAEGGAFPYIEYSDDQAYATLPVPSLRIIGLHDVDKDEIACFAGRHDKELGSRLRVRTGVRPFPDVIGARRIGRYAASRGRDRHIETC